MEGSSNKLTNLNVHGNKDAGVQLSNGVANNTLTSVYSYSNADSTGENADGFAIKLHSGTGNKLISCTAEGNTGAVFDRNNQNGVVTMTGCTATNNTGGNYQWPLTGTPSTLGYKVTFAKAIITNCTSSGGGSNDLTGATVTNSPTVK